MKLLSPGVCSGSKGVAILLLVELIIMRSNANKLLFSSLRLWSDGLYYLLGESNSQPSLIDKI